MITTNRMCENNYSKNYLEQIISLNNTHTASYTNYTNLTNKSLCGKFSKLEKKQITSYVHHHDSTKTFIISFLHKSPHIIQSLFTPTFFCEATLISYNASSQLNTRNLLGPSGPVTGIGKEIKQIRYVSDINWWYIMWLLRKTLLGGKHFWRQGRLGLSTISLPYVSDIDVDVRSVLIGSTASNTALHHHLLPRNYPDF
jgi:hypothetical protein